VVRLASLPRGKGGLLAQGRAVVDAGAAGNFLSIIGNLAALWVHKGFEAANRPRTFMLGGMPKTLFTLFAACWALMAGYPNAAHAQDAPWQVRSIEGFVALRPPGETARAARLNEALVPGTVLTTGAESRAIVESGAQRMVVSANSRLTIAPRNSGMTRVMQDLGSIFFQIDHRSAPHFVVETPRLAAVVKGTSFSVTVAPQSSAVSVEDGLLEVRANEGGAAIDVATGESARVTEAAPSELVLTRANEAASGVLQLRGAFDANGRSASSAPVRREAQSAEPTAAAAAPASTARANPPRQGNFMKFMFGYFAACFAIGLGAFLAIRLSERMDRRKRAL
jgi:hypothetical protein